MTEAEKLHCYVSDTYKDVYGIRPRHYTFEQLNSVEFLRAELNRLDSELAKQFEEDCDERDYTG
jgi:hypothetical protein